MSFAIKLLISVGIILLCTQIGKRIPSLAGLIAVMPITGLIVLLWLYTDHPGDHDLMTAYTRGAVWGSLPSIAFFLVAFLCFSKQLSLPVVMAASFGVWLAGAAIHQYLLR
jgi:uncharacterized membrane protein (GlpM family)